VRGAKRFEINMWSKFLFVAVALAPLPGIASAQQNVNVLNGDERGLQIQQKIKELQQQKKLDDAYRAASKKIPDQKANDPWAEVRPSPSTPAPKKKPQ
jgi:hypothetical protein